ncbi:hypothetical protein GCM10007981_00710 [Thermocladium modestius]|uniref:Transposase n=1 Tax=Thermocladium modestius TaxID=62609 RepID=A0A830GRF0_9CREN|nr:hypothetical protein [Thermocladium modestius]GGP18960.1 hypothetical protein GCM10007981_00710 [Thermocladium modestius]
MPDRLKDRELERRRAIVEHRGKTLRIIIAKTRKCFTIVTIFPDPGQIPDITLD